MPTIQSNTLWLSSCKGELLETKPIQNWQQLQFLYEPFEAHSKKESIHIDPHIKLYSIKKLYNNSEWGEHLSNPPG